MRGFGTLQIAFAHESQLDLNAMALDLDPLDIRTRYAFAVGSVTSTGQVLSDSVGVRDCLSALKPYYEDAKTKWVREESDPFKLRGVGVGPMWYGIGATGTQNPSTAKIAMAPDGNVTLYTGRADIGQGSSTVLTQIAAEVLGLDPRALRVVAADTRHTTDAGGASASRQTYISGNAVKEAAERLADALKSETADEIGAAKSSLTFSGGKRWRLRTPSCAYPSRNWRDAFTPNALPSPLRTLRPRPPRP